MSSILLVAALVASTSIAVPALAQKMDVVRFGLQIGAVGPLRMTIVEEGKKQGLDIQIKDFRDATAVMLAIESGELDIGNVTNQHVIRAATEGIDIVVVAGWGGGSNALIANEAVPVGENDWAGFRKFVATRKQAGEPVKIGVGTGSMQHLKLLVALKEHGIDQKDVNIVNVPFPVHPRAIDGKQVDMVMSIAIFGCFNLVKKTGKLVYHAAPKQGTVQEISFAVKGVATRERTEYVQRIVNAIVASMKTFEGNVDRQIDLHTKYLKVPRPLIDCYWRQFMRPTFKIDMQELGLLAKQMHEHKWSKDDQTRKLGKYIDFRFLEKATGLTQEQLGKL